MQWHKSNSIFSDLTEYAALELLIDSKVGILLDREIVENVVFSLVQLNNGLKTIFIDTVVFDQNGWKHLHNSEIDTPQILLCPERLLDHSTNLDSNAVDWRTKNREHQLNKETIIKLFKALPYGIELTTKSGKKLKMIHGYDQSWSKIECLNIEKNERFCYSYLDFNAADLAQVLSKVTTQQPH
ncbi:hypothetical protein [Comamonas sp.]|uniref:hypothetical protein n=1 Tax=Comamonas sp. TaxID=34028 RepID=UPI0012C5FE7B|nr:hypothetical protein [Comamonas sp.]MPS92955.1 hypothetical protein [Comamonas sp.]